MLGARAAAWCGYTRRIPMAANRDLVRGARLVDALDRRVNLAKQL